MAVRSFKQKKSRGSKRRFERSALVLGMLAGLGCHVEGSAPTDSKDNLFSPLPQGNPQNPGSSQTANLSVTLDRTSIYPIFCEELGFDHGADGRKLVAGQDLSQAYAEAGIQLSVWSADMSAQGRGIAFDSNSPTGGDEDLGTPNRAHGGPGVGAGNNNTVRRNNLLIKAESTVDLDGDGLVDVPDDDARGGVFVFDFSAPRCLTDIGLLDIEPGEGPVRLRGFDASGRQLFEHRANGRGDNAFQHHNFTPGDNTCGITQLQVHLPGSGAIESLRVCDGIASADVSLRDDLIDARSVTLRVGIDAIHKQRGAIKLVDTSFKLDPTTLKLDGELGSIGLVTAAVPTGRYSGVQVNILDVSVEFNNGTTKSYNVSAGYFIDKVFMMQSCRDADVALQLDIAPQFVGDGRGLDLRAEPWGPSVTYQQVSCAP